ncbi:hypothetical protein JTE90_014749 [Oedothorax gibbosus]|uniref:Metalloendopeptidase n=1 Tax=Oedothorax gibbosus TaxID=931172 RepID=A0AAV6USG0_9ARAC|nr:hypothetical protein JTE90_014749 [Oedothorax gibbosus]
MLWKFFLSLTALMGQQSNSPVDELQYQPSALPADRIFIPSQTGPQSRSAQEQASRALHGEHFGGDMVFSESWNTSDAGVRDTRFRWPGYPGGAVIPYVIDQSAMNFRNVILQGMDHYHRFTCIRFVPRTNQRDFIRIFYGNGCWSIIGRAGGRQDLSLGQGCAYVGLVIHELGHAIGLFHEHQRSDRDNYITVYRNNVVSGQEHNFDSTNPNNELIYTQYDYNSIMHYGNYAFSRQPNTLPTMVAKNGQRLVEPYDKAGFTNSDLVTIRKLYQCS